MIILKLVASSLMLLCTIFVTSMYYTAIQPEVYTNLTLEQFKNPNIQTDTSLRLLSGVDYYLALPFVVWFLVTLFIFKKEFVNLCTRLSK